MRTISLVSCLLALAAPSGLAQTSSRFPARVVDLGESVLYDIVAGDLDGDGWTDLIATQPSTFEDLLVVMRGLPGGDLADPVVLDTRLFAGFSEVDMLGLADFDEDGNLDVVVGSNSSVFSGCGVLVLLGDGLGGFSSSAQFAIGAQVTALQCEDVDADGHQDLLFLDLSDGDARDVEILFGGGDGAFTAAAVTFQDDVELVLAADLNGDEPLDLVALTHADGAEGADVALAGPARSFGPPTRWRTSTELPAQVVAADLDGDGAQDLVVSSGATFDKVELFWNDGSGGFAMTGAVSIPDGIETRDLTCSDLDADGDLDILVQLDFGGRVGIRAVGASGVAVLKNEGARILRHAESLPLEKEITGVTSRPFRGSTFVLADLDRDGVEDLVYRKDGLVLGMSGRGDGSFEAPSGFLPMPATLENTVVLVADADGDGDEDVLVHHALPVNALYIYWNEGGDWSTTTILTPTTAGEGALGVADLDRDCVPDVLKMNLGELVVWRGAGAKQFDAAARYPISGSLSYFTSVPLALGDWDGDGAVDVAYAVSLGTGIRWNDGAGGFGPELLLTPMTANSPMAVADVDGDGLDELFFSGPSGVERIEADASRTFGDVETVWGVTGSTLVLEPTDFDGDGPLDLVGTDTEEMFVLLGDGLGGFTGTATTPTFPPETIAVADLDGDGIQDVVETSSIGDYSTELDPSRFQVCYGGQGGELLPAEGLYSLGVGARNLDVPRITLADLDQDGQAELVALPQVGDVGRLHDTLPLLGDRHCQPDLGFGGPGEARLTACGEELSNGGRTTLRVFGARANTAVFLAVSTGFGPSPLFGGCLAPNPLELQLMLPTDASGSATLPGIPGGRGPFSLYLQAAYLDQRLAGQVGFTNTLRLDFLP